ncbi:c-type cytochrome [Aequorivita sp. H23M31]|uniref:Photosynthetic reaction center cytochrome c subunit n=1 Tax=Aequorivita ciconiae TaxID=2494375 RepID=A0A410G1U1_9FLAO|nr:c-type cytochrome [Aequorivita sp. H23M31]QAA81232.1 c-type cytochrome [Aequorivita sp. H23M31]
MKTKKKILTIFSIIGFLILAVSLSAFNVTPNLDEGYMPQPKWKNLKVLPQDITKDSLDNLMKGYTVALGVKCNYCHMPSKTDPTKLDFADDGKIEKEIARGMITMADDINEKYFKPYFPDPKPDQVYVVACIMCHRGAPNPEKYLSQMHMAYKTYNPDRDNRKEKEMEERQKQ